MFDVFDSELSEQCSTYSIANINEQKRSSFLYKSLKYDFLINRVQFILSFNLLLRLFKLQILVIK